VDLRDIVPTGKDGRILKEDILQYLEQRSVKGLYITYPQFL